MIDGSPDPYTWDWWKVAVALVAGAISGVLTAALGWWTLRQRVEKLEHSRALGIERQKNEALRARPFCEVQKKEILDLLRQEICQIVKASMRDMTIQHNGEMADIKLQLALVIQGNVNIREDIVELTTRMNNRRSTDP